MLNLPTSQQIREADAYTIASKAISSLDLMENAARVFCQIFKNEYPDKSKSVSIYCGTGNNGGDGLAIARLLCEDGYEVSVKIVRFNSKTTTDFDINLQRSTSIPVSEITDTATIQTENSEIIVDALLGSGLNRPLTGQWGMLVKSINELGSKIVSVDVPSGFPAEGPISSKAEIINADLVISFQRPKINFFLPESAVSVKRFEIADIGLDESFIQSCKTPYRLLTLEDIRKLLKPRQPFSHKGTYGHALIIAGTAETMGAALLCSEACLNTGAGLITACIPSEGLTALNSGTPEVMAALRRDGKLPDLSWGRFQVMAVGPGLGVTEASNQMLEEAFGKFHKPVVIDADAISLIAANHELIKSVPKGSIFTPHVKEFDRLFGKHSCWWNRLQTGLKQARELQCTVILKNRYTFIFTPEGDCFINPTGSPAMATGGAGDVLTGMITSFIAQGCNPEQAAVLGVYIHGFCGEKLAENAAVVTPGNIIRNIPEIIKRLL